VPTHQSTAARLRQHQFQPQSRRRGCTSHLAKFGGSPIQRDSTLGVLHDTLARGKAHAKEKHRSQIAITAYRLQRKQFVTHRLNNHKQ
jgi:hypothetical protein